MSELTTETRSKTLWITLDRPEARNSLTITLVRGLREALERAALDPSLRSVVLRGAGDHFCAGADLRKNMENPEAMAHLEEYMDDFHGLIRAVVRCPKPTVAMVDGAAVGFGADLSFACDLRVVSERSYVQEKFVSIGLMPDGGGTFWLPRLLGTARAMQMCLLADKLDGKTLAQQGVAVAAVPHGELEARTTELCNRLEKGPPLAFAAIKESLYASWGDFEAALTRERTHQLRLLRTSDLMEGVMAFLQKREPVFEGR